MADRLPINGLIAMSDVDLFRPYPVKPSLARQIASYARQYYLEALEELEAQRRNGNAHQSATVDRRDVEALAASTGVVDMFVAAIVEYNETSESPRSIAKLNAAYREQREANYGVDSSDYEAGGPCEGRSHDEDLKLAEARVTGELYKEYMLLQQKMIAETERAGLSNGAKATTRRPSRPRPSSVDR